jgi:hypothetical protein
MLFICVLLKFTKYICEENIPLIYYIQYVIPCLHLSSFQPVLQPYRHTPDTELQDCCLQLVHASLQLTPYRPPKHANNSKIIQKSKVLLMKMVAL